MPANVGGDRGAVAGVDAEVIVVDDESADEAAEVATDVDARVVGEDVQNTWLGSDAAPTRAPKCARPNESHISGGENIDLVAPKTALETSFIRSGSVF